MRDHSIGCDVCEERRPAIGGGHESTARTVAEDHRIDPEPVEYLETRDWPARGRRAFGGEVLDVDLKESRTVILPGDKRTAEVVGRDHRIGFEAVLRRDWNAVEQPGPLAHLRMYAGAEPGKGQEHRRST